MTILHKLKNFCRCESNFIPCDLISSSQTAYLKSRYKSECKNFLYNLVEIASILDRRFLVRVVIEKAFDSVDHSFLLPVLQKYSSREHFL